MNKLSVGEMSRQKIVRSAQKILVNEGFNAVTHRSVAEDAGVPLGSTTYHFKDKSELIMEAIKGLLAEEKIRRSKVRTLINPSQNQLFAYLLEMLLPPEFRSRKKLGIIFERLVEASRVTKVRKLFTEDQRELNSILSKNLVAWNIGVSADLVQAVFDGRALQWINSDQDVKSLIESLRKDFHLLQRI